MNSLQLLSGVGRKAVIALIMITTLSLMAAAQKIEPQSQGRHYGDAGFRGEPINLNVVNADIRDILNYITEQYGINFVIDKSVKAVPVTVNVNEVPWNIALDSILQSQELGVQVNGSILRVAEKATLAAEFERDERVREGQLSTSPLYTEFIRLNYARAAGTLSGAAGSAGALTTGTSASTASSGGGAGANGGGADQGILGIIKRRLSRRGAVEVDGRSNTIIITDVRENIDAIRQLVTLLDQPEPQVEIEARIVVASRNFSRDVGIQLAALVTGPRGSGANGQTMTMANVPNNIPTANTGEGSSLKSQLVNTAIGLTTGVFGTAQISALITAGETKGQAKVIATPRVTTLNNRPAEIKSGQKIPVVTVQPGSGGAGGAAIATTEYVDVPLRLAITPQITDVGTVILNVVAENSSLPRLVQGGSAPSINTQSMTTQVTVPDGGTTVVGGVLSDDERESVDRTPGISRIPLFGNLFKRKGVQRDTSEILFFITPRIYRPDFNGASTEADKPRSTTIIQPVPLGNPASNSDMPSQTPVLPVVPGAVPVQPAVAAPAAAPAKP